MKGLNPRLTIVDEWDPSEQAKKKAEKTRRYHRQQANAKKATASKTRTRPSDVAPKRITDGMPLGDVRHKPIVKRRALTLQEMNELLLMTADVPQIHK